VDDSGNVIIRKPATGNRQGVTPVILQGHQDMVPQANAGTRHDFSIDPIRAVVDGEWVRAEGTTLGADNGIGVAAIIGILESRDIAHGPLEALFTSNEESGMDGAFGLKAGMLEGRILINTDSEEEGELCIGCAGGINVTSRFLCTREKVGGDWAVYRLSVTGLRGGHSGVDIHRSRGNAVSLLFRILKETAGESGLRVSELDSGNMRNAIPRNAYAIFTIPGTVNSHIERYFKKYTETISAELKDYEPNILLKLEKTDLPGMVLSKDQQIKFLQSIEDCPHGVISWSPKLEGMVETSTNLASVKLLDGHKAVVTTSQRSSMEPAKKEIAALIRRCLEQGGGMVEHSDGYPGWTPNTDSEILRITRLAYRELFGKDPVIRAIHAGLECGLILEKYPDLDMLSFGPTIKGAHTPAERIDIGSTERFYLCAVRVQWRRKEHHLKGHFRIIETGTR